MKRFVYFSIVPSTQFRNGEDAEEWHYESKYQCVPFHRFLPVTSNWYSIHIYWSVLTAHFSQLKVQTAVLASSPFRLSNVSFHWFPAVHLMMLCAVSASHATNTMAVTSIIPTVWWSRLVSADLVMLLITVEVIVDLPCLKLVFYDWKSSIWTIVFRRKDRKWEKP